MRRQIIVSLSVHYTQIICTYIRPNPVFYISSRYIETVKVPRTKVISSEKMKITKKINAPTFSFSEQNVRNLLGNSKKDVSETSLNMSKPK